MKLCYVGSGYVGQVNAAGSAYYGHHVTLVDVDANKVNAINQGKPTIFEKDLDSLLYEVVVKKKQLSATTDLDAAIHASDVSFICVGTPDRGGMIDLSYIQTVAKRIGQALRTQSNYHVIIVKSTVVPGTTLNTVKVLLEESSGKKATVDFGVAMNPEFLREGVALDDCLHPDSIIIGTEDARTKQILREVYAWAPDNKITNVGITAAEAIKYAKNAFLATKITFANEIANYCDVMKIDAKEVLSAMGLDKRISPLFLRNGPGYGGSCFPKDVNAIIHEGQVHHTPFRVLEQVVAVNNQQYLQLIDLARAKFGSIDRKKVGILGLSFKPDTDDTRESPALKIIAYLVSQGCEIKVFCPQGMKMAKEWLEANHITNIQYCPSMEKCVTGVDFVLIPTDWAVFRSLLPKITVPTFIAHRDFVDPAQYPNVYVLGFPK